MKINKKQTKLFLLLAISILIVLLIINAIQLFYIFKNKNEITDQEKEISNLDNQISYYQNQSSTNKDEKNNDVEIVIEGE